MDNDLIFHISSLVHQQKLTQRFEFFGDETEFIYRFEWDNYRDEIHVRVSPYGQVTLHFSVASMSPQAACVIACAGTSLIKPLIECYNPDMQQYLDCLKIKGLVAAYDIAACAAGCLAPQTGQ